MSPFKRKRKTARRQTDCSPAPGHQERRASGGNRLCPLLPTAPSNLSTLTSVQGWSAGEKRDGKVFLQCLFRPPTPELTREVGCLSEGPDLPPTLKETESQEGEL